MPVPFILRLSGKDRSHVQQYLSKENPAGKMLESATNVGGDTFECECAREWDLDLFSTDCGPPAQLAYVHPRRLGLGQWSRKEHEHLWLLRAGAVKVPPPQVRPRSIIYAPRGRHSEKPQAAWDVIEAVSRSVLPGVVGVEFNSRERRFGWAAFGALDGEDQPLRFESTDDREDDQGGRT